MPAIADDEGDAGQANLCCVPHGLVHAKLYVRRAQEQCLPPEQPHARLGRHASTGRTFLEDHRDRFAQQRLFLLRLHRARRHNGSMRVIKRCQRGVNKICNRRLEHLTWLGCAILWTRVSMTLRDDRCEVHLNVTVWRTAVPTVVESAGRCCEYCIVSCCDGLDGIPTAIL